MKTKINTLGEIKIKQKTGKRFIFVVKNESGIAVNLTGFTAQFAVKSQDYIDGDLVAYKSTIHNATIADAITGKVEVILDTALTTEMALTEKSPHILAIKLTETLSNLSDEYQYLLTVEPTIF